MAVSHRILFVCFVAASSVITEATNLRARAKVSAEAAAAASGISPMRRVVNMLVMMQKKVASQSKTDDEIFDKFMCYCTTNKDKNKEQVGVYMERIPQLESSIQEVTAMQSQLESELAQHTQDRDASRETIAEATAMRNKDASAYLAESTEQKANIEAVGKAVKALQAGMGKEAFLQTNFASRIQRLLVTAPPAHSYDREELAAFLQQGAETQDSGEVLGILQQMKEEFEKDLKEMVSKEEEAIASFEALVQAKQEEVEAASRQVEDKEGRLGDVKVDVTEFKHDLDKTQGSMGRSEGLLLRLSKECADRGADHAIMKKERAEENVALADTIKVLNDDDAQDLFSKTLPATSFIQVSAKSKSREISVIQSLSQMAEQHVDQPMLGLLATRAAAAARQPTKKNSAKAYMKVVILIDDMVDVLRGEQQEDDQKRDMCRSEIPRNENNLVQLQKGIKSKNADIDNEDDQLGTLKSEMNGLKARVMDLDKAVEGATAQRKTENTNFVEILASNNAALQLLEIAQNSLNKYYNKKLHKEAAPRQLSEGQRITENFGGEIEPTAPPGGIADTGVEVTSFLQMRDESDNDFGLSVVSGAQSFPVALPQESRAPVAGGEAGGVLQLLGMLREDIKKEIKSDELTEKHSQEDYEGMVEASKTRRQSIAEEITLKQGTYANLEDSSQSLEDQKSEYEDESASTVKVIANLKQDCTFLLKTYEERKTARTNEMDNLVKAKEVMVGADFRAGRALENAGVV